MKLFTYFIITLVLAMGCTQLRAEDEARLNVTFNGIDDELLENVRRHVRLVARIEDEDPISDGERRRLQRRVVSEVKQALEPYGYYQVQVKRNFDVPGNTLVYNVNLNEPVTISQVSLELSGTGAVADVMDKWRREFPLKQGQQLNSPAYESAKKTLLAEALRLGYFDARFSTAKIEIDQTRTEANIRLAFNSGERYRVGDIVIEWRSESGDEVKRKRRVERDVLESLVTIETGQYYSAETLTATQRNLQTAPYVSSVEVRTGDTDTRQSTVPVTIALTPNKRAAYNAEIGVGTDTGIRGGIGYENRRVNQQGHNASVRFGGSEIERTAIINYRIPLPRRASDSLNFFGSLEEEIGDSRQFETRKIGSELSLAWKKSLLKFGIVASRETFSRVTDGSIETEQTTDLLMPSISFERTERDNLYFPKRGWSVTAQVRAASKELASDIDLAQVILNTKAITPFGDGQLKFRLKVAGSLIDESTDLPESLGFLAGGDESVRGYKYESIGVERNGATSIGKNLIVGSVEYQYPVWENIAVATFLDAGDAFDGNADYKRGAGVGLRWRLPFGALRLDAASALDREGDPWRLHFSFGTDL